MYSNRENEKGAASFFLSWQFLVVKLFALALITVYLCPPTGSLSGRISFEQEGFGLQTSALNARKVSVVAIGPRGLDSDERGVWVDKDGKFRVNQLPVGEYELRVRCPGFSTEYVNDIYVDDGEVAELPRIVTMNLLSPSVTIASNKRVYTTKEVPSMWSNVSAGKALTVNVYKKELTDLLHSAKLKKSGYAVSASMALSQTDYGLTPTDPFTGEKPFRQFKRDVDPTADDEVREDVAFSKPLPAGDYVAVADALSMNGKKHSYSAMMFTVTDLGLIIKKAPDKTLVRAIDLNTLKPLEGASISLVDKETASAVPTTSTTDKDGFAEVAMNQKLQTTGYAHIMVIGKLGANRAYEGVDWWENREDRYSTLLYTDRPVYRLGQTVYFKGIVRQFAAKGMQNPGSGVDVEVKIETPENVELKTFNLTTSEHGTFHGSVVVPDDGHTGSYSMSVKLPDDSVAYGSFSIEQYRKPEFQVEVTPVTARVAAGTQAAVRVKATYFFGAPVTNARVKYSIFSQADYMMRYAIMPRPKYYEFFDDWNDDEDSSDTARWYSSSSGGSFEKNDFVQLDENGEALIKFDTLAMKHDDKNPYDSNYGDQSYRVDAEVTDLTRMAVSSSASVAVTPADFELFVNPSSYVNKVGEPFKAKVQAVDYDGKPVVNQPLTLQLARYMWDTAKNQFRGIDVKSTVTVNTDKDGMATVTFATGDQWPSDTFFITAESTDKTGHIAYGESSIWIASKTLPFHIWGEAQAEKQPFDIKLDKKIYKPGETAKIMVSAPVQGNEGIDAIVSVEGSRIYSYKLAQLNATAQLVEVPIKAEYTPNAFISVTMVGKKHQFYTTQKMIRVSPQDNFLNVSITTDKPKYKVGETVKYTLKATHMDGTPAPSTELSLGVVDESIYSIMPDTTENIQKFFYRRRSNWVVTTSSFPEEYSGGPDKTEPHVRKDFKDTAAWFPDLVTDKNGIAIANVKLPDNLTTWRATVRGIDLKTDVGAAVQKIIVTQDLIVRMGVPRFFTQEDQGTISAVVHNYTNQAQKVRLTFSLSPQITTHTPLTQTLNIQPDKAARFDWPVTAALPGTATLGVKAIGQTASDAIERTLPVRALGIPSFSCKAGLLTDENASVTLPIGMSSDTAPGTGKYSISLASSTIGPVVGNFNSLIEYPYGCTEQTLSKTIPSVVAFKLHDQLGLPLSKAELKKFDKVYEKSIEKLTTYRHGDGGWGWWQTDQSQPYLTSLVIDGLSLINSTHRYADPHKEWIDGAVKWLKSGLTTLQKQLSDPNLNTEQPYYFYEYNTDMCFSLYAIGLNEKLPKDQTDWVVARYKELSPEGLAYLTMALKKDGRLNDAKKVYDRLIFFANVHSDYADWDHTPELRGKLALHGMNEYSYRFTGVESTALALRAVLAMEPDNSKLIESVKQWLLVQRTQGGWDNTKTTSEVFQVLLQEELLARSKWPTEFTTDATLQEKLLHEYIFNQSNEFEPEKNFVLDATAKPTNLTIKKTGTGRLYYNSLYTCFRRLHSGDQVAEKAMPDGLKLSRAFYRIVPGQMKSDGTIHCRTVPITDGKIKAGETILMKTFVETPISVPYVMLEAPLPSGGEIVGSGPDDSTLDDANGNAPTLEGDWTAPWWTHQDVLDDRIVFFGTSLPAGKSEFHTLVRMESPGKLNMDPVRIEGMYTNKVRGYSGLDTLNVTE